MKNLLKTFIAMALVPAAMAMAEQPREVVERFGAALIRENAAGLRATLPTEGKVGVRLVRLGPEDGALRGGQLQAVLQDFLERGSVQSFKLQTIERTDNQALATADVDLIDTHGARAKVRLHLSLEPEGERWVLREIRESSR